MLWYQSLLVSISGGIVAALVTMWLSLRRFYRERWWQRRFDGCAAVIEAVHDEKRYTDLLWGEEAEGKAYSESYKENAFQLSANGARILRRYADLGELALPRSVAQLVQQYVQSLGGPRSDSWLEHLDEQRDREQRLLDALPEAAMRGLGLTTRRKANRLIQQNDVP